MIIFFNKVWKKYSEICHNPDATIVEFISMVPIGVASPVRDQLLAGVRRFHPRG